LMSPDASAEMPSNPGARNNCVEVVNTIRMEQERTDSVTTVQHWGDHTWPPRKTLSSAKTGIRGVGSSVSSISYPGGL
jgi:hypothetical protein